MARQLLLIESDPGTAEDVRRAFAPAGFAVVTLNAGERAVEQCRESPPDLIVLSAELPDMSGFSVCNRLKRAAASVPLILYSEAAASAIDAHRATRTHADAYLPKPLDLAELMGQAAHLLENGSGAGAPPTSEGSQPPPPPHRPPAGSAPPARSAQNPPASNGAAPARGHQIPARPAPEAAGGEITDPFADWPRDPAPPKGTPEEKLEFFRERMRVKDTFLARVRDVFASLQSEVSGLRDEVATHSAAAAAEADRRAQVEAMLAEQTPRLAALEQKLAEAETTRQSLSEVLNESIQNHEEAQQQWSRRLAAADDERSKLETQLREAQEEHGRTLEAQAADRATEREELTAQLGELTAERDDLELEKKRLYSQIDHIREAHEQNLGEVQQELESTRTALDEARGRAQAFAGELAEVRTAAESTSAELALQQEARAGLEQQVKQARAEANAYNEKALAAEHAYHARTQELEAARKRIQELATALDEGRASVQGVQGEVARLQEELAAGTQRMSQLASERDQLAKQVDVEHRTAASARSTVERLEAEVARLAKLEPLAEEITKVRRELAHAQESMQQRTQQAQSAARTAHELAAERERLKEKHEVELTNVTSEVSRRDSELSALRRRVAELETNHVSQGAESQKLAATLDAIKRSHAEERAENDRRNGAEATRLKQALVDMEKHLETRARNEAMLKKRISELERSPAASATSASPDALAQLQKVTDELEELRGENEFLNSEVARYHQKNKDLQAQLPSRKGS
jgi:CheY-like chemotaxis protein